MKIKVIGVFKNNRKKEIEVKSNNVLSESEVNIFMDNINKSIMDVKEKFKICYYSIVANNGKEVLRKDIKDIIPPNMISQFNRRVLRN